MRHPQGAVLVIPLSPRRLLVPGVLLAGVIALLLCQGPSTARYAPVPTDPPRELQLVPPDASFVVHIRLASLLNHELTKSLTTLAPLLTQMRPEDFDLDELPMPLSDIDSVALLGSHEYFLTVVTTRKPYDRDKVLKALAPEAAAHVVNGKPIHVVDFSKDRGPGNFDPAPKDKPIDPRDIPRDGFKEGGDEREERKAFPPSEFKDYHGRDRKPGAPPRWRFDPSAPAVHLLDARTVVYGEAIAVVHLLEKGSKPDDRHPLHPALSRAGKHHLTVGASLSRDFARMMGQELGLGLEGPFGQMLAAGIGPLLNARKTVLTADLAADSRLDATLSFPDARAALRGRDAARLFLSLFKGLLNHVEEDLGEELGGAEKLRGSKLLGLLDTVRQSIEDATVKAEESSVRVGVRLKLESETLKAVVADTTPRLGGLMDRRTALNNLKQLGIAFHNYESAMGHMPPATIYSPDGKPLYSWRVAILPYLEQETIYRELKLDQPWDSEHNKKVLAKVKMPKVFELPGVKAPEHHTFFQLFTGPGTAFDGPRGPRLPATYQDGTSNTLLVVEAAESVHWAAPGDITYSAKVSPLKQIGKHYGKGTLVAMADGSVRIVPLTVTEADLRAAITPRGNEVPGPSLFAEPGRGFRDLQGRHPETLPTDKALPREDPLPPELRKERGPEKEKP